MIVLKHFLLIALVTAGLSAYAEEQTGRPGSFPQGKREWGNRGERGEHGGRGGFMPQNKRFEAEQKLKEQFPAEFAEIQKLRDEAEKKLQELAKKANIELPAPQKSMQERMAELKAKYPEEFARMEELRKTDPMAAFGIMRQLMEKERGGNAENSANPEKAAPERKVGNQLKELQKKYPKEMAEIRDLRRKDPKKAAEKVQELLKKLEKEGEK